MDAESDDLYDLAQRVADGAGGESVPEDAFRAAISRSSGAADRHALEQLLALSRLVAACEALQSGRDPAEVVETSAPIAAAAAAGASASAGASAAPREMPSSWGHLELRACLGEGVFGSVYRAYDPRLDTEVALKLLEPSRTPQDFVVHEGRLLARVRHPHVVTVHGAAEHDGRTGLWMELVLGRTLADIVGRDGPLGASEAALLGIDLCGALAAVHAAGLLHRDVKAQNVMRAAGGRTVLMDLGAGLDLRDAGAVAANDVSGTPLYMAPELFTGAAATPAADLYSLGVLLFFAATGRYPVEGASVLDLIEAHAARRRQRLRDVRPDLPAAFVEAVEGALDADPRRRVNSAGALEAALRRVVGPQGGPVDETAALPRRRGFWMKFKLGPLQVSFGAALVLALTVGGAAYLKGGGGAVTGGKNLGGDGAALVTHGPPVSLPHLLGLSSVIDGATLRVTAARPVFLYVLALDGNGAATLLHASAPDVPGSDAAAGVRDAATGARDTATGVRIPAGTEHVLVAGTLEAWDWASAAASGAQAVVDAATREAQARPERFELQVLEVHGTRRAPAASQGAVSR